MKGFGVVPLVKMEFVLVKRAFAEKQITVGSLMQELGTCAAHKPVIFGCEELEFFRLKDAGDCVVIEFAQSVYRDDSGQLVIVEHH
jgi:hypothetical protein